MAYGALLTDMQTALRLCALALLFAAVGCRMFNDDAVVQRQSPLRPITPSPDSVALEIVWARFPLDDPELNGSTWNEIDETQIAPAVYRELTRNGFRAGVIAGTPPDAIARALNLAAADPYDKPPEGDPMLQTVDLTVEAKIQRRILQLRRGKRAEIQASEMLEAIPLLVSRGEELGGRTYREAQAVYGLEVDPQSDLTCVVELTPELQWGQPRIRWTGGDEGILRQMPMREREVFESLRTSVRLAPGEMIVLMSLPDSASRLGHYFHTAESASGRQQKLVVIRLAQVPASDTFADAVRE